MMAKLRDIAKVCKSKNAGPFEITIDIMFENRELFDRVLATNVFCPELFARQYSVNVEDVTFTVYPPALAFKGTVPRKVSSGNVGDTDVYGAQQHAPMLDVEVPI